MNNLTRIPHHLNYYANRLGDIYEWKDNTFHLVQQYVTYSNHHEVYLTSPSRKTIRRSVHRLICLTFNGYPPPNTICCHRNDIKSDNRPENLYWGSYSDNNNDFQRNKSTPEYKAHNKPTTTGLATLNNLKWADDILSQPLPRKGP